MSDGATPKIFLLHAHATIYTHTHGWGLPFVSLMAHTADLAGVCVNLGRDQPRRRDAAAASVGSIGCCKHRQASVVSTVKTLTGTQEVHDIHSVGQKSCYSKGGGSLCGRDFMAGKLLI